MIFQKYLQVIFEIFRSHFEPISEQFARLKKYVYHYPVGVFKKFIWINGLLLKNVRNIF